MNTIEERAPGVKATDRVLLFDGVCKLCAAWSKFLIRFDRDHRFKLATVQSPEGRAILGWYGLPTDHFDTMVLVEGARLYTESSAFLRVMGGLPFPWPAVSAGWAVPRFLRDRAYRRLAQNRYRWFGRYDTCAMPRQEDEGRYFREEGSLEDLTGTSPRL